MATAPLSPADLGRYGDCVCFNIRWFSRLVTQYYERRLRSAGLRFTTTPILARLAAGPMKTAGLADWLAMERTALLRTVQPLIDDGYVASRPAHRGRGHELALTPAGFRRLAELKPEWEKVQAEVVRALGGAQWRGFLTAMEAAAAKLEAN